MKLIIFDMDGLMFDTEAVTYRAFAEKHAEAGLETSFDIFRDMIGLDKKSSCAYYRSRYGSDFDAEGLYDCIGKRFNEIMHIEGVPMKPGLLPLLDAIDALGLKKVIASGSSRKQIVHNLSAHGLEDRFDAIISSDQVEHGKPEPDVFLACCEEVGIAPEEALVLEDSPMGIRAAINGNIPVIAVPDLIPIPEELAAQCVTVQEDLEQVIPFIRGRKGPEGTMGFAN